MKPDAHKSKATRNWKKKNGIVDEKPIVKPKVKEQPNRYDSDEKEYDSEELREMEEELAAEQELLDMAKNRGIDLVLRQNLHPISNSKTKNCRK